MILLSTLALLTTGQVYRWVDREGEHFTNDKSTVPKGVKLLPFEPGPDDVSIHDVDDGPAPTPVAPAPVAPAPAAPASAKRRTPVVPPHHEDESDERDPRIDMGPLPKTLKPGDAEVLLSAVQAAENSTRLKALGGLRRSVRLDVIERADDVRLAKVPEWAGGFAVSPTQVYLLSPYIGQLGGGRPRPWAKMVLHELAHAQQYQWSGAQNVPRWFAEGYAMYVAEDEPAASPADIAWWAIRHGDGAPLQNAFSAASPARPQVRGHERADHALMDYGLSLEAVTLLVKLGQESGISLLLRTLSENVPFAQAFQRTFRMELPEFERLLLAKLRPAYQERAEEPR